MMRLALAVLALLLTSFVGSAFAAGCSGGAHLGRDAVGIAAPPCCALEANCASGACFAGAVHRICDVGTHKIAIKPQVGASDFKKVSPEIVTATRAIGTTPWDYAARSPPIRMDPLSVIARYRDTYARTGRLLI